MKNPKIVNTNSLKDALYNTSYDCTRDTDTKIEYGKGVLVGVVATLMSLGHTFEQSCAVANEYMPKNLDNACVPPSWLLSFPEVTK